MFTNIHMVAAGFSLRRKVRIKANPETQPKGCGYLENVCPEGASSSGRSPGRGAGTQAVNIEDKGLISCFIPMRDPGS